MTENDDFIAPHKRGPWYKQGVISILLEHFIHQLLNAGDTTDLKYEVLAQDLPKWKEAVEASQQESRRVMERADFRTLVRAAAHLGLLEEHHPHHMEGGHLHASCRQLKLQRKEVEQHRQKLERAIQHNSEVFSTMDLDILSENQLMDTGEQVDVEEKIRQEFKECSDKFKEEAITKIQEHPDNDLESLERDMSGLKTTQDEFLDTLRAGYRKLAVHTQGLQQLDEAALKEMAAKQPRHRKTGGCFRWKHHKSSKATKLRGKPWAGETAEQHALRLRVHSLMKVDVQHQPGDDKEVVEVDGITTTTQSVELVRSPIHDLRDLLSVVPVVQLCMMVESIHEMEQAKGSDKRLTEAISLDQASTWRYQRYYLNQPIEAWLSSITVPGYVDVVETDGKMKKSRVQKSLSRQALEDLTAAFKKRDIRTIGEMLNHRMTDMEMQHLIKGADGTHLPMSIVRRLRAAQGEWADVTFAVETQRWIRLPPTELKHDESASLIIGMLWRQVFVWAGTPFCPWLPFVACILQVIMFTSLQHSLIYGRYTPPRQPWAAGTTTELFMRFGMQTLLLCVLPTTMWLNAQPECGPHKGIQIASTFSLFEQDVIKPWFSAEAGVASDGVGHAGLELDSTARTVYTVVSFVARYLLNPTFLILAVFVMWTRGRTRKMQLNVMTSNVRQLQKQSKLDANYLQSRLRAAKQSEDKEQEAISIHEEQQKMHQHIMACMGSEQKSLIGSALKPGDEAKAAAEANEAFMSVKTLTWPLSEADGDRYRVQTAKRRRHVPVIWMMQDTSVPNFTQFTVRVNDLVVVQPQLQRNDLCGDVPGEDHTLVLEFNVPDDVFPDHVRAEVSIVSTDASCFAKSKFALSSIALPEYTYECVLICKYTGPRGARRLWFLCACVACAVCCFCAQKLVCCLCILSSLACSETAFARVQPRTATVSP